jgi:cytochrome c oxidase assembly protein subunit 15
MCQHVSNLSILTLLQFSLGVWALLSYVPVHLGSAHQANALTLFTAMLVTLHSLRPAEMGPLSLSLARFGTPAAALAVLSVGLAVTTNY